MDDPSASQPSKARKAECASCGGPRNCDIRGEYSDPFDDGYETVWRILQCRGCGSVFVQTVSSNPENVDSEPNELGETIWFCITIEKYWPALTKRKKPEWIREYGVLDAEEVGALNRVLREVYDALEHDMRTLAGIGIRTAFDVASGLLGVDKDLTFKAKIEALVTQGHINAVDLCRIKTLIESGSATAHRESYPNPEELNTMMEVLEHFLHKIWVAPDKEKRLNENAAKVKKAVPPRKERAKESKTSK